MLAYLLGCADLQGLLATDSYNDESLAGLIDRLSEFDRDMNTAVVESGILTGIPQGALYRAGTPTPIEHP